MKARIDEINANTETTILFGDKKQHTVKFVAPSETQTATATIDNKAVTFSIDNVNARINNKPAKMDVPARLVNGKTMVPLRFLSENMGYDVDWDADSRTAIVR